MTRAHDQQGDLLPCPCCTAKARVSRKSGLKGLAVKTRWMRETVACKCGLSITGKRPGEAVAAWNRRALSPPMTSPAADIQECHDALEAEREDREITEKRLRDEIAELRSAQTSPAAGAVEREKVARIVDPWPFQFADSSTYEYTARRRLDEAYAKADAILSALSLVGGGATPPD